MTSPTNAIPDLNSRIEISREQELDKLKQKLEILKKKRDQAEKEKDLELLADLTTYAIPDLDHRIESLMRDGDPNPATKAREKKLEKLKEKLEILKKRRDEAEKAKDLELLADLDIYAIPDLNHQIEILMRGKEDEKTSPAQPKPHARPPEIQTDGEPSD